MQLSRTPGLDFVWNKETGEIKGNPCSYTTSGAAVSQVEIDCLTGDHTVLKTDIVMDVGRSINPTIDIGQVNNSCRDFNYYLDRGFSNCGSRPQMGSRNKLAFCALCRKTLRIPVVPRKFLKKLV